MTVNSLIWTLAIGGAIVSIALLLILYVRAAKRSDARLAVSESHYRQLFETAQEAAKKAVMHSLDDLEAQINELRMFKMAVIGSSDQIVISDVEGVVLYANEASEKITGYKVSEIIGSKAGSLWGGHMESAYYQEMWATIKDHKQTFIAQIDNVRKNGQAYTSEIHISPMLDDSGNPEYFVSIERDITREKEIDKAKTEFVSLASHQLRTPLGISKWYLEAIREDSYFKNAPKPLLAYLDEIYSSNERVLSLARDLLSVSQIDQGIIRKVTEPTNITNLVKDIFNGMTIVAAQKKINLELVVTETNIPDVSIDPKQFHEVLENLITNALEYTLPHGGVVVTLGKAPGGKVAQVSVEDNGIGIAPAAQKQLFTKFFRSEKAVSTNPNGSGLGLYVVKSYVEDWGGQVLVKSQEGKGSTFTVTIPINLKVPIKKGVS